NPTRALDGDGRAAAADTDDHRDALLQLRAGSLRELAQLSFRERRPFAGRARDDDAVRAVLDVKFEEPGPCVEIHFPIATHGRDDGHQAALKHLCQLPEKELPTEGSPSLPAKRRAARHFFGTGTSSRRPVVHFGPAATDPSNPPKM